MGNIAIFDLVKLKTVFDLLDFVETGTLHGDGVQSVIDQVRFRKFYSIEIEESLAKAAQERFKDNDRVEIINDNSIDGLKSIIDNLGPTLFWLDAHFPGADAKIRNYGDEPQEVIRVPLKEELEIIAKNSLFDVIIIDDLWLYEDGPYEFGLFNDHARRHNMNVTRESICNQSADFVYELFGNTHTIEKDYRHGGYLILKPI